MRHHLTETSAAASVQGTIALGDSRGARLRRLGDAAEPVETPTPGPCHARANGFDLHAGLVVPARQRERLERIVRYTLRPPAAQERLHLTHDGQVRLGLRHPWRDGTTALVFDPVEFLGRLAVLVPRPRINLLLYYGVLGPRAAWRAEVVPRQTTSGGGEAALTEPATEPAREPDPAEMARRQARAQCWASLMAPSGLMCWRAPGVAAACVSSRSSRRRPSSAGSSGIWVCRPKSPCRVRRARRRSRREFPTRPAGTTTPGCSTRVLDASQRRSAVGAPKVCLVSPGQRRAETSPRLTTRLREF